MRPLIVRSVTTPSVTNVHRADAGTAAPNFVSCCACPHSQLGSIKVLRVGAPPWEIAAGP